MIYILMLFVWGEEYMPTENVKYGILVDSVGVEMGLMNGDRIISIDNQEIEKFYQIIPDIVLNEGGDWQIFDTKNETILKSGEQGFIRLICNENNITV